MGRAEQSKNQALSGRLKAETRDLHEAVEREVDVMREDLSDQHYLRLVCRFYGFYKPLESRLEGVAGLEEACPDLARRRKAPLLERDLATLSLSSGEIRDIPRCAILPEVLSPYDGLGCLYVMEGATLGGAIISRHVTARLGVTAEAGAAFFSSYGDGRGAMWKAFIACLDAVPADRHEDVVAAARQTFSRFTNWLKPA